MADTTNANPLSSADLAAFVAAVEAASIHGAADALNLTQSAVTKRLQALERRAGVELLERGRFGVRPTAAGRLLYPEAKQALAALQRADHALAAHREVARHALALAASHTIGEFLLPGWLALFRLQEAVLRAVRERSVQIGFVEGLDDLEGFETLTVHRDRIVAVVSAQHRWARRRQIAAAELTGEPYITREAGSGTRAVADAAMARLGIHLEPTTETASLQSVKRALATGGFALLSELAIEAERRSGTLCAVPLRDLELVRELRAVHDRRVCLSGVAARFWAWLQTRALARTPEAPPPQAGPARPLPHPT